MTTEDNIQNFIQRLDDLLQRYNDLLNMNFEKECLRSMKIQEMKYKEKIAALEAKLRITKMKLKFETDRRIKSEEERDKLVETFKSELAEDKPRTIDALSTSNESFITALNSFMFAENDLNESNLLPSSFRKHRANLQCSHVPGFDSNTNSSEVFKIPSKNSYRFTTKIKSPDISYPGFEKLKEKYPSEFNKSPEPSPIKNEDLRPKMTYSDSQKAPVNHGSEKFVRSRYETIKVTPTKNSCPSYFSPRKESTPLAGKSICLDVSIDHCNLHESDNERSISRLAPLIPPMIPMAVIHCIDEIEKRGLKEIGLYRMAGDEEDIMNLHEKFENFEADIDLSEINIHSIAAFLKSFLCNFPLIPKTFHDTFAQIIIENDKDDLYYAISDLPQANRDTLAYLIIHLRRVSFAALCKMPPSRLSAVFGPIVFGMHACDKENQFSDIPISVMEELLKLPSSYWNSFIVDPTSSETPTKLRNSPTTELIVRKKANKYFTTNVHKKKFFS